MPRVMSIFEQGEQESGVPCSPVCNKQNAKSSSSEQVSVTLGGMRSPMPSQWGGFVPWITP